MQQIDKNVFYVEVLEEILEKKDNLLDSLIELTNQQQEVLSQEKVEYEIIQKLILQKEEAIQTILKMDEGFRSLYEKVKLELKENKEQLEQNIKRIQELIKLVVEKGIRLKGLENQNKVLFEKYIREEKAKIGTFTKNNVAANIYYKNMINLQTNESYFLDKKK